MTLQIPSIAHLSPDTSIIEDAPEISHDSIMEDVDKLLG